MVPQCARHPQNPAGTSLSWVRALSGQTEREERERERDGSQRETFVHQLFGLNVFLLTDGAPRVVLILEGIVAGQ